MEADYMMEDDDIHICGGCRTEFTSVSDFVEHKKQCVATKTRSKKLPELQQFHNQYRSSDCRRIDADHKTTHSLENSSGAKNEQRINNDNFEYVNSSHKPIFHQGENTSINARQEYYLHSDSIHGNANVHSVHYHEAEDLHKNEEHQLHSQQIFEKNTDNAMSLLHQAKISFVDESEEAEMLSNDQSIHQERRFSGELESLLVRNHEIEKESNSDSSTPCPEDIEVGQISAAIVGKEDQHQCLKSLLGMDQGFKLTQHKHPRKELKSINKLDESNTDEYFPTGVNSSSSKLKLTRNITSSAPITKHQKVNEQVGVKKTAEKRERLQGVSDDLLSPAPGVGHYAITSNSSMFSSYKAIFTSPSSAGRRLDPRQACDIPERDVLDSYSNVPEGAFSFRKKSMVFKDISASVKQENIGQSSCMSVKVLQHQIASRKDDKTERQIVFDIDPNQVSDLCKQEVLPVSYIESTNNTNESRYIYSVAEPNVNASVQEQNQPLGLVPLLQSGQDQLTCTANNVDSRVLTTVQPQEQDTVIMVYRQVADNSVETLNLPNAVPASSESTDLMLPQMINNFIPPTAVEASSLLSNQQTVIQMQTNPVQITSADLQISQLDYNQVQLVGTPEVESKEKYIMKPRVRSSANKQKAAVQSQLKPPLAKTKPDAALVNQESIPIAKVKKTPPSSEQQEADDKGGITMFSCDVLNCNYSSTSKKDLLRHKRTHTGECPFKCEKCGKTFPRSDKLNIHMRWHVGVKPYKCSQCDYACYESGSLKKHMRIHNDERPFKCQICPYASRNSSQLVVHLRTHTGDSPFHCTVCEAQFKINSDLKRHMRIHTGEKPYQCQLCDYKSSNKGNLKTHEKNNHSKENEKRCPKCEFASSSIKQFREHIKSHDATSLVRCSQCDYTCTSLMTLRNHIRHHNPARPFQCHLCSYSSKNRGNLKKHLQNVHQDKVKQKAHGKKFTVSAEAPHPSAEVKKQVKASHQDPPADSVRMRNSRRLHHCSKCGSSFVREDSLRCHMRQHTEIHEEVSDHVCGQSSSPCNMITVPTSAPMLGKGSGRSFSSQGISQIAAAASKAFQEQFPQPGSESIYQNENESISKRIREKSPEPKELHINVHNQHNIKDETDTDINVEFGSSIGSSISLDSNTTSSAKSSGMLKQCLKETSVKTPVKNKSSPKKKSNKRLKVSPETAASMATSINLMRSNQSMRQANAQMPVPQVTFNGTGTRTLLPVQGDLSAYNIQLVPQVVNRGMASGSHVLTLAQEPLQQPTHIQILLSGAMGGTGPGPQQLMFQVQNQNQEVIHLPLEQVNAALQTDLQGVSNFQQNQANLGFSRSYNIREPALNVEPSLSSQNMSVQNSAVQLTQTNDIRLIEFNDGNVMHQSAQPDVSCRTRQSSVVHVPVSGNTLSMAKLSVNNDNLASMQTTNNTHKVFVQETQDIQFCNQSYNVVEFS